MKNMKKPQRWSKEKYMYALNGEPGVSGLRTLVIGFNVEDGYDFRKYTSWTKPQRERVRKYFGYVKFLEAQPRRIVRPRIIENLRRLQRRFHGGVPSKMFKVAFVPHQEAATLPGSKPIHSKLVFTKNVIWDVYSSYKRGYVEFDKVALAVNPELELERAFNALKTASAFYVQTGEFQTLNSSYPEELTSKILKWMQQYDGVNQLPQGSGNVGDDPKHHHWRYWLEGLIGIATPKNVDVYEITKKIIDGIIEAKRRNAELRKKNNRKYGRFNAQELLNKLDNPLVKFRDKIQIKRELTKRKVAYPKTK